MNLSDITVTVPRLAEFQVRELKNLIIDEAIKVTPDEDLIMLRELVAQEHEQVWPPLGDMVRRTDPRKSEAVRAELFRRLPPPTLDEIRAAWSQSNSKAFRE